MSISNNFPHVERQLKELGRQAPFVAAVSLTRTAKDMQTRLRDEMRSVFDRPTNYTLNSTFLKAATKQSQEAKVWLKDNPFGKGTPADRYLAPQIYGGVRGMKGMERALQLARLMPNGAVAVPAAGAQLDANGNVKRNQIVQILSQLQVQAKAGFESRASKSKASQRTVARQGVTYFCLPTAQRGLQPGIYLKRKFAHGSAIRPVFLFVASATYRPRLKFFEVGDRAAQERFPVHFAREFERALKEALRQ
jgi:hypothetical protein